MVNRERPQTFGALGMGLADPCGNPSLGKSNSISASHRCSTQVYGARLRIMALSWQPDSDTRLHYITLENYLQWPK